MIRILITDDHDVVRQGIKSVLELEPDFEVCGEANNGRMAIKIAQELQPNIVILDVSMPELNGIETAKEIRRKNPNTEVLIFTMHKTENLFQEAIRAGIKGFILKSDGIKILIQAVYTLAKHKPFFSSDFSDILLSNYKEKIDSTETQKDFLTNREREIVQLIAEGKSNKEIASIISISPKTVETHRAKIMNKLSLHSTAEIVRYAIRNNLIEP